MPATSCLSTQFLDTLLAGHRLTWPFSGARVGSGSLPADGQAAPMPQPSITTNVSQTRDVLLHLPAQRPFDRVFAIEDTSQPADVVVREFLGAPLRIHVGLLAQP